MVLSDEVFEQFKSDLSVAKSYDDLMGKDGAIKKLIKKSLEVMLDAELSIHLGYDKYSPQGKNSGNSRNGKINKLVKNDNGEFDIAVPRDRNGSFEPAIIKKYQRTIGTIEDKIIAMYAKGMSVRDIEDILSEIYGTEFSSATISHVTDKINDTVKEWQNRPLDNIYPIIFLDAIFYKVHSNGRVINKASYSCLAIDIYGKKELLGIWVAETEGAHFWLSVLTELKNRGVKDVLIVCVDGLNGFPEAINTVFPNAQVQQCIVHLIRNTLKYVANKDCKDFVQDLKNVYKASTEEAALMALDKLDEIWGKKYKLAIKIWRDHWAFAATFFEYPEEIRRVIYTTNAVEALHRQFRKVTKSKTIFPHDDSLKKMIFLAYRDIAKKWTMPIKNWPLILSHFSIIFHDRINCYL